jgi:hypothetical protein
MPTSDTMGHMRNDIKRSESVLTRLEATAGLSDCGKEWVIAAFDPFHDRDLDVSGYPDTNGQNSMTQTVNLTVQISSPTPGSAATWDCHIIDWPFLGPITSSKEGAAQYNASYPDSTGGVPLNVYNTNPGGLNTLISGGFGGLTYGTFPTSGLTNDIFNTTTPPLTWGNLTLPPGYLQNSYRVIAKAFEVYNTSNELNQQGAVVVYKQPTPDIGTATTININTPSPPYGFAVVDALFMKAPPATASEALLLNNSRQWKASEGCYVIPTVHGEGIEQHLANWTQPLYYKNTPGDSSVYSTSVTSWEVSGGAFYSLAFADQHFTNFDQTGAMFTGLGEFTTLTVNYRLIIEVFPTSSSILATFAKPSCEYDPVALEVYSRLAHRAPVGVEVKYNGLGDWFIDGIKAVADVAMPIGQRLLAASGHPLAKVARQALGVKKKAAPKKGAKSALANKPKGQNKAGLKASLAAGALSG